MSTYIEIPASDLLGELRTISEAIKKKGGEAVESRSGKEIIFDFTPPDAAARVRVYTTLAVGQDFVRECGKDAVRLTVGTTLTGKFRSVTKPKKILRTAPKGTNKARIRAFLDRLTKHLRVAYKIAAVAPKCPKCNMLMAERKATATGREFYGCLNFPECRGTRQKNSN